jgi:hypothetical protein
MDDYKIHGKMKSLFGLPNKTLSRMKYDLSMLYHYSTPENFIHIEDIHKLIIKFFHNEYFPLISRNIKVDEHTIAIIMGGVAFNMNIPVQLPYYRVGTDDIDLKIYTTAINYLEKNDRAIARILSVYRFTNIIICMYLKQILNFIKYFSESIPDIELPPLKRAEQKQYTLKREIEHEESEADLDEADLDEADLDQKASMDINQNKKKTRKSAVGKQSGGGGEKNNVLDVAKFGHGHLTDYKIIMQIKKKDENNINIIQKELEIETINYNDIYNIIMENITDIDTTITVKIDYNLKYNPEIKKARGHRKITFSDCTIIYPSLGNPGFFSYYFTNNSTNANILIHDSESSPALATLVKKKLPISSILGVKRCGNNCRFLDIETLMIDTVLMISFANYLEYENLNIPDAKILVPVGYLWKYWKYMTKFIRLITLDKHFKGTLSGGFQRQLRQLETFLKLKLRKPTNQFNELDPVNIQYKKMINDFHQGFFINQSLIITEYPELHEIAERYLKLVINIESSRALFKKLDDQRADKGQTVNSLTIQYASLQKTKITESLKASKQSQHSKSQPPRDPAYHGKKTRKIERQPAKPNKTNKLKRRRNRNRNKHRKTQKKQ